MFVQSHLPHQCMDSKSTPSIAQSASLAHIEPVVSLGVGVALPAVSQHAEEETKHRLLSLLLTHGLNHQKSPLFMDPPWSKLEALRLVRREKYTTSLAAEKNLMITLSSFKGHNCGGVRNSSGWNGWWWITIVQRVEIHWPDGLTFTFHGPCCWSVDGTQSEPDFFRLNRDQKSACTKLNSGPCKAPALMEF